MAVVLAGYEYRDGWGYFKLDDLSGPYAYDGTTMTLMGGVGGGGPGTADSTAANQATQITAEQAIQTSVQTMDDWDESDRAKANIIVGQAGITAGAGAVAANTPRITHASDDPLVVATLTNTQLRASPVPVSITGGGDATAANQVLQLALATTTDQYTSRLASVSGRKTAGSAIATNAWQVGGTYNATPPTLTDGQEVALQVDASGALITAGGGGAGDASAANQATQITAAASTNTKLDTLHTDITAANTQLPATLGSKTTAGSLATVGSPVEFAIVGSTVTREANTTAYAANDAVSNAATAGSVTPITFTLADFNDMPLTLTRCRIHSTDTGFAAANFAIFLYQTDPTASTGVVGGDNAAFSTKKGTFIGRMSGTFRTFSDGAVCCLTPDEGSYIIAMPTTGAKTIFGLLQTLSAATPSANSTTFIPTLEGFQGRA